MVKFVISPARFIEACTVMEYVNILLGNMGGQMTALPKFLVDENNKYVVEVVHNEDGDPVEFKNLDLTNDYMNKIGINRFEKLRKELTEAAKNIVNPPKGGDSSKQAPP